MIDASVGPAILAAPEWLEGAALGEFLRGPGGLDLRAGESLGHILGISALSLATWLVVVGCGRMIGYW